MLIIRHKYLWKFRITSAIYFRLMYSMDGKQTHCFLMYNSRQQKQESLVLLHHRRWQEGSIVLDRYSYAIHRCGIYNGFVRASPRETICIVASLIFDNIKRLNKYSEISFWHLTQVKSKKWKVFLYINLSSCSECCILSFWWFSGVWILYADVSAHFLCSIFIGDVSKKVYVFNVE